MKPFSYIYMSPDRKTFHAQRVRDELNACSGKISIEYRPTSRFGPRFILSK